MRVLVTRPLPEALATAAALRAAGHEPVVAPLFSVEPTGSLVPDDGCEAVLVTSPHALEAVAAQVSVWRARPLHVVGARAAAAATGFDWMPTTVAPDAKTLASRLLSQFRAPTPLLYLAGAERKPDLEARLRKGGHFVTTCDVYRTVMVSELPPIAQQALSLGALDVVLHFSPRSASHFRGLAQVAGLEQAALRLKHVSISADAAVPWVEAKPHVAAVPTEAGLLDALNSLC